MISQGFIIVLAYSLPLFPDSGTDIVFFDVEIWAVDPLLIGGPYKAANFGVFPFHAIPQLLNDKFPLILLFFLDFGQYGTHIKL